MHCQGEISTKMKKYIFELSPNYAFFDIKIMQILDICDINVSDRMITADIVKTSLCW